MLLNENMYLYKLKFKAKIHLTCIPYAQSLPIRAPITVWTIQIDLQKSKEQMTLILSKLSLH